MKQVSNSQQKTPHSRHKFTTDVIQAIKDLEVRRQSRTLDELSDAAWEKLQFDLPIVESAELTALLQKWRSSLHGKISWPCYLLTQKALENIVTGSRRTVVRDVVLEEQPQQLEQLLAGTSVSMAGKAQQHDSSKQDGKAHATTATIAGMAREESMLQKTAGHSVQDLYKELCAVVFLQYVSKVLSLAEQDAWQLLQDFQPDEPQPVQHKQKEQPHPEQISTQLQQGAMTDGRLLDSVMAPSLQADAAAHTVQETSQYVYEDTEAAEQDQDDEMYEPCEPLQACHTARRIDQSQQEQQQQQQYSWPELRHKLLNIVEHVQYSLLDYEPLWQPPASAADSLLQLLRALGVHSHAEDLQPLLAAYVNIQVDRIAAVPADVPSLQLLWEALGLTSQQQLKLPGNSRPGSTGRQRDPQDNSSEQQLPPEVVLGLSATASVWQQVTSSSSRSKLWKLIYENLLPLLEQCTEQLAYQSGRKRVTETSSSNGAASAAACQDQHRQGDVFAHMLLVAHVIELVVSGRPGSVDAAGQLTQLGVTRNLVQLFVQHATQPAAEPVRRALLLSCCSSQQTADWVLAISAVIKQLQQPELQPGGHAEAHGAIWQVLCCCRGKGATAGVISSSAAMVDRSSSSASNCQLILQILELQSDDVQQLQRQVVLLQLMSNAHRAAGRYKLWDEAVVAAVKRFAARVKQAQSSAQQQSTNPKAGMKADAKTLAAQATAAVESSCVVQELQGTGHGDNNTDTDDVGGDDDTKGLLKPGQQSGVMCADALQPRQLQQLWVAALRAVKELVTQTNKTD